MEVEHNMTRRFTPVNDGLRGYMIGWDNVPAQGDKLMVQGTPYNVEEVSPQGRAGIWTASLEVV
jgi:hypothetical protein